MSGGHTAFVPKKDASFESKSKLIADMDVAMGGRAAEELIFGKDHVTGGASADLNNATSVAEAMVRKLGMSDKIGLRVYTNDSGNGSEIGPATYEQIDDEINVMLNESYKRAVVILKSHRRELDLIADALLNYETLDADDVKAIIEGNHKSLAKKKKELRNSKLNLGKSGGPGTRLSPNSGHSQGDVLVQSQVK